MILIFTVIILIHELGHFITGYLLGWNINKIMLYPYGGCSYFDEDINVPLKEEFLVLIMGPIVQLVFIFLLKYVVDYTDYEIFLRYSNYLLVFNLLPIYPLDGGKFIQIVLSFFISYYRSLQVTIYFSFGFFMLMLFFSCAFLYHFSFLLILIVLFFTLWKEIKQVAFYYQKFLLERYFYDYSFRKYKSVDNHYQMMRDAYHLISGLDENVYLKKIFGRQR